MNIPIHSVRFHQCTLPAVRRLSRYLRADVSYLPILVSGVVLALVLPTKTMANPNGHQDIAAQQVSQSGPYRYRSDNRRYDNRYYNNSGNRHYNSNYRPYYRPFYRSYYPWGLGWGIGLSTGWNDWGSAGWNSDWGWRSSRYWNSPYSGIGLSIPLGNREPVALSPTVQVTTSMQYSHSAGAMVSSMPTNTRMMSTSSNNGQNKRKNNGQSDSDNNQLSAYQDSAQTASRGANTSQSRALRSLATLPSNARVLQQDGRTLYEWQGSFYVFDWNSQTYQEQ